MKPKKFLEITKIYETETIKEKKRKETKTKSKSKTKFTFYAHKTRDTLVCTAKVY